MKWLYRLDYKYHNYYIRRLMTIIIAGMVVVYALNFVFPYNITSMLTLNRTAIVQNLQLWRLVTFLFVPPQASGLWMLFALYFYWMMGTNLENIWGGFRFNLYYLVGWLGAIIAMFITGAASNTYLNLSLFLAFATVSPDTSFMLFFILPIKAKWMAGAYALFLALDLARAFIGYGWAAGFPVLITLLFSLLNYLLFFGQGLFETIRTELQVRRQRRQWRNNNRR